MYYKIFRNLKRHLALWIPVWLILRMISNSQALQPWASHFASLCLKPFQRSLAVAVQSSYLQLRFRVLFSSTVSVLTEESHKRGYMPFIILCHGINKP